MKHLMLNWASWHFGMTLQRITKMIPMLQSCCMRNHRNCPQNAFQRLPPLERPPDPTWDTRRASGKLNFEPQNFSCAVFQKKRYSVMCICKYLGNNFPFQLLSLSPIPKWYIKCVELRKKKVISTGL